MKKVETLTSAQLNAHLWRQQGFDRSSPWSLDIAHTMLPIHYATGKTLYPSLLARHEPLAFAAIAHALDVDRALVRFRAMRGTLFAIPQRFVATVIQATRRQNQAFSQRTLAYYGITDAQFVETKSRILAALDSSDLTVAQLKKAIAPLPREVENGFGSIRSTLSWEGSIIRARSAAGWRSDTCTYARFKHWLPDVDADALEPARAAVELALAYFAAFGPATQEDFQWWSGMTRGEAALALDSAAPQLRPVAVEGQPAPYWMADRELAGQEVTPAIQPTIRLLPVWDAYVMAYRDRGRYLEPALRDRIYDAAGNSASALLVDGRIGGVWDWQEAGKRHLFKFAPFEPLSDAQWQATAQEAGRLALAASGGPITSLEIRRCAPPQSLLRGGQNLFKSPLQDDEGVVV